MFLGTQEVRWPGLTEPRVAAANRQVFWRKRIGYWIEQHGGNWPQKQEQIWEKHHQ